VRWQPSGGYGQVMMRKRSLLRNIELTGVLAGLALVANGLLNDRLPAAWIFAAAIFGVLVIAVAVTAARDR
jgi:lysylphosphatidylglycerol synthetase-like protein (DUF2156 family)